MPCEYVEPIKANLMKTISVGTLPSFIRSVREAQGLPQKDIAQKINVWPSALTQYEKTDASLSKEKLLEIAPLLNINPEFIKQGIGNPFKADKTALIKMLLMLSDENIINLSLLRYIAEFNEKATFIFLKPIEVPKDRPRLMSKWQRTGSTICALLVQDDDGNRFLFKMKDDSFFNENNIVPVLRDTSLGYHKNHKITVTGISLALVDQIRNWENLGRSDFDSLVATGQSRDQVEMLSELIDFLLMYGENEEDRQALERLKTTIQHLNPQNAVSQLYALRLKITQSLRSTDLVKSN